MVDAIELLRDFSALQGRLVQAFILAASPRDMEYFQDVADGHLSVDGDDWTYKKHGRGVRFVCHDGRIVDVHIAMNQHPAGVTAWRLLQYLESLGIDKIGFERLACSARDEVELEWLLVQMKNAGVVQSVGGRIYEPIFVRQIMP